MSSESTSSMEGAAPKTPRMANLDDGEHSTTDDTNTTLSTGMRETKQMEDKKSSSSYEHKANSSDMMKAVGSAGSNKRTTRRSSRRRGRSLNRSAAYRSPATTPLKNHNTNSNMSIQSNCTSPSMSATGLIEMANSAVNTIHSSPPYLPASTVKTKSKHQLRPTTTSSPPRRPDDHTQWLSKPRSSETPEPQNRAREPEPETRDYTSWTFQEKELNSLLQQSSRANPSSAMLQAGADCLDMSLHILKASVQQAKQLDCSSTSHAQYDRTGDNKSVDPAEDYEEFDDEEEDDDDQYTQQTRHDVKSQDEKPADPNVQQGDSKSSWWMSIVQRLQESHDAERFKWKDDLRVAKLQGKHLKSELRESIEQRIQWLEDRLAWEDQLRNGQNNHQGAETITSVSSGTTMVTASTFGNQTNFTVDERNSVCRSAAGAATNGLEVSFDTAHAIQRLGELEQRVKDFEHEKEQWERALAHAEMELQKDKKLSSAMQEQLQRLAQEVDSFSDTNHKHCKEKQKVQKQLLQLLEQQLATERCEWQQEKELLDHTIQQLTLDKAQASVELQNTEEKLHRLLREEKRLRAQRETWLYDKNLMEISIQQLLTDKSAYKASAENLRRELMEIKRQLGENVDGDSTSEGPQVVESVYSELDENLDRAVAERDLYKQEAEMLRKTLEEERANWLESEAAADDTLSEIRNEFSSIIDELKVQLQKATSTTPVENGGSICNGERESPETKEEEEEEQLTLIRNEYTAVIDDLEARLDSQQSTEAQQLRESLARNKELVVKLKNLERQHADERGEWKLRLEAALAEGRRVRETKESLEVEVRNLKSVELEPKPIDDEENTALQKALVEVERLQLELARLRQNYEAEVQMIFENAKARQSPNNKGDWKLQLEASLAETRRVRKLKEDLEIEIRQLKDAFKKEKDTWLDAGNFDVDALQRKIEMLEESGKILHEERSLLKAENQRLQAVEHQLDHFKDLYSDLKEKYHREVEEWSSQLEESRLHEEVEIDELKKKHERETKDLQKSIRKEQKIVQELKEQHATVIKELKKGDPKMLEKYNQLLEELRKFKMQHSHAKAKWENQYQLTVTEKDARIRELELTLSQMEKNATNLDQLSTSITDLVTGLRTELNTVIARSTSNNLVDDRSKLTELQTGVRDIQNSVNDALAELTLEADAVMEIKALVESIALRQTQSSNETAHALTLQHRLLEDVKELCAGINQVREGDPPNITNELYHECLLELQRKVTVIAELQADLERTKHDLELKASLLVDAEAEINALHEQADAYSDEIMRTQAFNAELEQSLRLAERKLQALMNAPNMPRDADEFDDYGNSKTEDDSTPMLEEALALAHGLQELVHGKDSEQNVLDMLQSLSDLIDQHERSDETLSRCSSKENSAGNISDCNLETRTQSPGSSQRRQCMEPRDSDVAQRDGEDPPPDPVHTPRPKTHSYDEQVPLQIVVEQLYNRCQMLERERTSMMEITLNLMESARKANAAEMEAALATVRRRTMEDAVRTRQQITMKQDRLYKRVYLENGTENAIITKTLSPPKYVERGQQVSYAE